MLGFYCMKFFSFVFELFSWICAWNFCGLKYYLTFALTCSEKIHMPDNYGNQELYHAEEQMDCDAAYSISFTIHNLGLSETDVMG